MSDFYERFLADQEANNSIEGESLESNSPSSVSEPYLSDEEWAKAYDAEHAPKPKIDRWEENEAQAQSEAADLSDSDLMSDAGTTARTFGARFIAGGEKAAAGMIGAFQDDATKHIPKGREEEYQGYSLVDPTTRGQLPQELYDEAQGVLDYLSENEKMKTKTGEIMSGAIDSMSQQIIPMSLGVLLRRPSLALTMMGGTTFGTTYADGNAKGLSRVDNFKNSIIQGAAEMGTEMLPFMQFAKMLKPGTKKFTKEAVKYAMEEFPGEALATAIQNSSDAYFSQKDPEKRNQEVFDYLSSPQHGQDQIDTFLQTLAQTLMMTGGAKALNTVNKKLNDKFTKNSGIGNDLGSGGENIGTQPPSDAGAAGTEGEDQVLDHPAPTDEVSDEDLRGMDPLFRAGVFRIRAEKAGIPQGQQREWIKEQEEQFKSNTSVNEAMANAGIDVDGSDSAVDSSQNGEEVDQAEDETSNEDFDGLIIEPTPIEEPVAPANIESEQVDNIPEYIGVTDDGMEIYGNDGVPHTIYDPATGETIPYQVSENQVQASDSSLDEKIHEESATSPHNDLKEPTEEQKHNGKYDKARVDPEDTHLKMGIKIENPAGSVRSGVSENGKKWETPIEHHYGYLENTKGYDKDEIDIFLGPKAETANSVFVIDQLNQDGSFDEHKAMLGFDNAADAEAGYVANYEDGWDSFAGVTEMTTDAFKAWSQSDAPRMGAVAENFQAWSDNYYKKIDDDLQKFRDNADEEDRLLYDRISHIADLAEAKGEDLTKLLNKSRQRNRLAKETGRSDGAIRDMFHKYLEDRGLREKKKKANVFETVSKATFPKPWTNNSSKDHFHFFTEEFDSDNKNNDWASLNVWPKTGQYEIEIHLNDPENDFPPTLRRSGHKEPTGLSIAKITKLMSEAKAMLDESKVDKNHEFKSEADHREQELRNILKKRGIADDDTLVKDLLEERRKVDRKPDTASGLIERTLHEPTIERAIKDGGVFAYADIDIANLGGLNKFAGSIPLADKYFKGISQAMKKVVVEKYPNAQVFRKGGDELAVLVPGIKATTLDKTMAKAKRAVDKYVKEEGLSSIAHTKHGMPPGVTIEFGTADVDKFDSISGVFGEADGITEARKQDKAKSFKKSMDDIRVKKQRALSMKIDTNNDDSLKAISKLGGLKYSQVLSEWGKTIADSTVDLKKRGVFGHPVIRKTKGITLDSAVESLKEYGYLGEDADINSLLEIVEESIRGGMVYSIKKQDFVGDETFPGAEEYEIQQDMYSLEESEQFNYNGIQAGQPDDWGKEHHEFEFYIAEAKKYATEDKIDDLLGSIRNDSDIVKELSQIIKDGENGQNSEGNSSASEAAAPEEAATKPKASPETSEAAGIDRKGKAGRDGAKSNGGERQETVEKSISATGSLPPNHVFREVVDLYSGEKIGLEVEPHDGTEAGMFAAAKIISNRLEDNYDNASVSQSRTGITDENGNPAFVMTPNMQKIIPVGSTHGRALMGDLDAVKELYDKGEDKKVKEKVEVGQELVVAGSTAVVREVKTVDGVSYELYAFNGKDDGKGAARIYDLDSGNVIQLKTFSTLKGADEYLSRSVPVKEKAPSLSDKDNSVVKKGEDGKLFSGDKVASAFGSKPQGTGIATNDDMHFGDLAEESKQGDMSSSPAATVEEKAKVINKTAKPLLPKEEKEGYGSNNKLIDNDQIAEIRKRIQQKMRDQLNSGIDPELFALGTQLAVYHLEAGSRSFVKFAKAVVNDIGPGAKPFLKAWYSGARYYPGLDNDGMDNPTTVDVLNVDDIIEEEEKSDVINERVDTDLERDIKPGESKDNLGKEGVLNEVRPNDQPGEQGIPGTDDVRGSEGGRVSDDGSETVAPGERSDQSFYFDEPKHELAPGLAGSHDDNGSSDAGINGLFPDTIPPGAVSKVATRSLDLGKKRSLQRKANNIPVKLTDRANIEETLPFLHKGQHDDVAFAETRFMKPKGYGVMLTNGTGTGKTYSGLGLINRLERQGKTNILIATPDEKVMGDWIAAGQNLGLKITSLADTKDSGKGIVITTYANMGKNDQLATRDWDLIVSDESHKLMQSQDGKETLALLTLRAISNHPGGKSTRHNMLYRKESLELKRISDLKAAAADKVRKSTGDEYALAQGKLDKLQDRYDIAIKKYNDTRDKVFAEVDDSQGEGRTRVLMMSATPFAYEKTVQYAEGYLFDYPEGGYIGNSRQGGYEKFMVDHFGYEIKYHRLQYPPAEVNRGIMQRNFNSWLKKEKVLSGRMLVVSHDYDRKFILTENAIGVKIDEGLQFLSDNRRFNAVREKIAEKFDYLSRRYLLEAIKAREILPIIKENLNAGRKVVVFHDYKKGGGFNPFDVNNHKDSSTEVVIKNDGADQKTTLGALVREFMAERPDLINIDLSHLVSPIAAFRKYFSEGDNLLVVNGDEKKSDNLKAYKKFNDDNSGPQVMLIQSAKNAGWSGHDTTGKHQRIMFNLGLPTQPTMSIQQEGRIYRVGQASNAMFRYLNTGTNWERMAFAQTIAERSSAAENLAIGEEARALMDSFIDGFEASDNYPVGHEGEGTGGKDRDRDAAAVLSEWDRAMTMYWSQTKKNSRTKSREGKDYFSTPEPLGFKMVEWANIKPHDKALEPSAGHGAIARWFPDNIDRTVIEPSANLASRLKMVTDAKLLQHDFEGLHAVNKYDAIVMNPPFGVGGSDAIEHLKKATKHLRDGGRVVSIIPLGPAANKKFDKWFYGEDEKGRLLNPDLHIVSEIKLPSVTFERAGTKVLTRIVVIDKLSKGEAPQQSNMDFSREKTTTDFFAKIEDEVVPDRNTPETKSFTGITKFSGRGSILSNAPPGGFTEADRVPVPEGTKTEIIKGVHTKNGNEIFTVKMIDRVEKNVFNELKQVAKGLDGYYSFYRGGGAVPGFIFKSQESAQQFVDSMEQKSSFSLEAGQDKQNIAKTERLETTDGMSPVEVHEAIRSVIAGWTDAPPFLIVETEEELPNYIRRDILKSKVSGKIRGLYDPKSKSVFLISNNLQSPALAEKVLFHEVVGHYGLENTIGAGLQKVLSQVYMSRRVEANSIAKKYGFDTKTQEGRIQAAKEVIAHMAETNPSASLVNRVIEAIKTWLVKHGFTAWKYTDADIASMLVKSKAAMDNPQSVKAGGSQTSYSSTPEPFYSAMRKHLGEKLPNSGTGKQLKMVINNMAKKGQIKKEELEWSGLIEYLEVAEGKVTKDQILSFIDDNGVKIEDVVKQGDDRTEKEMAHAALINYADRRGYEFDDRGVDGYSYMMENGDVIAEGFSDDLAQELDIEEEDLDSDDETSYAKYTLPGGKNYREILLTLPVKNMDKADGSFTGSHWKEKNVIAHLRINDRIVNGEKVLFIEEIQSDYAMAGRRVGFRPTKTKVIKINDNKYLVKDENGKDLDVIDKTNYSGPWTEEAIKGVAERILKTHQESSLKVPKAPFVQNNNWQNLVLKRIVRMAAEEGHDRIAWINGEQTAERYSLDQQVESIGYEKRGDLYNITVVGKNNIGNIYQNQSASIEDLENVLGKEITKRIVDGHGDRAGNKTYLVGDNLKIEAAWARNLYDKAIQSWMKKFGKKYGAKVDDIVLDYDDDQGRFGAFDVPGKATQQSLQITDAMRSEVMQGLPLFSKEGNFDSWFNGSKIVNDDGSPKVVYHGTTDVIDAFDLNHHSRKDNGWLGDGVYLTNSKSIAESYSRIKSGAGTPTVMELYASIKNPYYTDIKDKKALKFGSREEAITRTKELQAQGYDGIVARGTGGFEEIVAFKPNQVKSIDNETYGETDKISYSLKDDGEFDEVEKAMGEAKGLGKESFTAKAKEKVEAFVKQSTRHHEHISAGADGEMADIIRLAEEIPSTSKYRAVEAIRRIVGKLTPDQMHIFSRNIIISDLLNDIATVEGEDKVYQPGESLPFNYSDRNHVESHLASYKDQLDDDIREALYTREEILTKQTEELVSGKHLNEEVLEDAGNYFHHQVLAYRGAKALGEKYSRAGTGTAIQDLRVKKKGWQKARTGSEQDYNTDYVESEFEILAQGYVTLATDAYLKELNDKFGIYGRVNQEAKDWNTSAVRKIYENAAAPGEEPVDPYAPFNQKIAIGFSSIARMISKGQVHIPARFQGFADFMEEIDGGSEGSHPQLFQFLSYSLDKNTEAAPAAGMIFKAIADRNKFTKSVLGESFKSYKDMTPDEFVDWKPTPGQAWYPVSSVSESVLDQVLAGDRILDSSDVKKQLARGRDEVFVIPVNLAKTLDSMNEYSKDTALGTASTALVSKWKQWILINPARVLKYNLNNMSGDLDIVLASYPGILKYTYQAARDLLTFHHTMFQSEVSDKLKAELEEAVTHGVLTSSMTVHEIPELSAKITKEAYLDAMGLGSGGWYKPGKIWTTLKKYTTLRENMLRLASYRYFKDNSHRNLYGASKHSQVDQVTDPVRKAALLSRELMIDYGNITETGQWLRQKAIPFWSWMEGNAPRYFRLIANIRHEEGGIGAGNVGKKVAVAGYKGTKLGLKTMILFALVNMYNHIFWPDEEDEMGEAQRKQLHIILGRNDAGEILSIRFQGALSDALSWAGLEDAPGDIRDLSSGDKDYRDMIKEGILATPFKLVNASRPILKTASEAIMGKSLYPDPSKPRPILDSWQHIFRLFSLDVPYKYATGKPMRGTSTSEQIMNDLISLGGYVTDPGMTAYYESRAGVFDWLDKKGIERSSGAPTSRGKALIYYKQAMKYGDLKAAERYLKKYVAKGGSKKGLVGSIKRSHPLASIKKSMRKEYLLSLSPAERKTLSAAINWYKKTYGGK